MSSINIYCLASVLSIIHAIWSSLIGIYFLILKFTYSMMKFDEFLLAFFVEAILYIGVFVGLRKRRPKFILPYLIGEIIYIGFWASFAVFGLIASGFLGGRSPGEEFFLILLSPAFSIFCYVIILKAHRRMKQEIFDQLPSVVFEFRENGRVAVIKNGTEV